MVVYLGINNIFYAKTDDSLKNVIDSLIDDLYFIENSIKQYSSDINVFFCMPPLPNFNRNKFYESYFSTQTFSRYVTNVQTLNSYLSVSQLKLIPCHLVIDGHTDMLDGIHPTNNAYEVKMATVIASRLAGGF